MRRGRVSKIDLHIHSNASDGHLSPEELVHKAVELGLTTIAITDHDSVDGVAPALAAAKSFPQLKVIPSVEISTDIPQGEVHILGYFIDCGNHELQTTLNRLRSSRRGRAQKMLAKLDELGIHIEWKRVQEIAGDSTIGRPHIAQAMLEKGYIASFQEAFNKYLGRDGPAYVERQKMTPVEAVSLILQASGLPVLAHPFTINPAINDLEPIINELQTAGLIGMEAYCHNYTDDQINSLVRLARKYGLITTGGSDYHGIATMDGTMMGGVYVPIEAAEQLIALAKQRASKRSHT